MQVQLIKQVIQNGQVVCEYKKDNDLLLNNFGKWLAKHFWSIPSPIVTLVDRTGIDRTIRVLRDVSNVNIFNNVAFGSPGLVGVVGSSGQAPNHTNFDLILPIAGTKTISSPIYSNGIVSLEFNHTPPEGQEVSEAGLVAFWIDTSNVQRSFLLVRDSFPKEVGSMVPFTLKFSYNFILV